MLRILLTFFLVSSLLMSARASHVMGGEITWECQGGSYVFQLVFYRDCNGAEVNTVSENIKVWYHPTVTDILVPFVSRTDISPLCTPVTGGPAQLDCGIDNGGGNGIGAIEKVIYRSAPIILSGTPGPNGWVFTYENFSRSNSLTNISDPSSYGVTITAKMFTISGSSGGCIDNSPKFLQEPYFVSCAGSPYVYNMNAVDQDMDSVAVDFGIPYDFLNGAIYDPPVVPAPVPFEPGFTYTSPTPGTVLNPSNIPASINNVTGEINFTSFTTGNFVVKVVARSYRNGILIAQVEREMQLIVLACTGTNDPPVFYEPNATTPMPTGGYTLTIDAGTLVNLPITTIPNPESLQDGSPQTNYLNASGIMFGTNFNSTGGCPISPCATLNPTPIISNPLSVSTNLNWQTTCDHLVDATGNAQDTVSYVFVFTTQDDYCPVPFVTYATVTINLVNPGVIQAPEINCIQHDAAGNAVINYTAIADPFGTFVKYELYSVQSGLITSSTTLSNNSFSVPATASEDYFLSVVSGCNGNATRFSDTVASIFLTLNNPSNGTAVLQWNDPADPAMSSMGSYYHIYREYPTGTWTLIDSVPYGVNFFKDTIDICQAYLNYQVVLPNQPCNYTSNIEGDDFEDILTPDIPVIHSVSIDTLTGNINLSWNQNNQPDTYGYVIYTFDENGFIYELDTVWGLTNTSYTHVTDTELGPLTYSVAAFDSCWTPAVPPTYQTSAKAETHTTVFLSTELDICNDQVSLSWTPYGGWSDLNGYEVWGRITGEAWTLMGSTTDNTLTVDVESLKDYCFFTMAISASGDTSYSNIRCLTIVAPLAPGYHYLQVATVENEAIRLEHLVESSSGVQAVLFEKMDKEGNYQPLAQVPVVSDNVTYLDTDVDVYSYSYTYRARVIDSCGKAGAESNIGKTILLNVQKDDVSLLSYLSWNPYQQFNGTILGYNVYRGIDGVFSSSPVAVLNYDQRSYTDTLTNVTFTGKVCYYIEAIEGSNLYDDPKISRSNDACVVFEPIVYIPNAFTPEGYNPCFFPVITNFDPVDYRFVIFDRWGQEIFHTTSPVDKWCGYIGNTEKMAETATYVYMLTIHDGAGNEIVRRGHVTLLR